MTSLLNNKQNFFMPFAVLLIFILLIPVGIYSQPREIVFDGTGTLTRDIVISKLTAENLQPNEEFSATIRNYTTIGASAFCYSPEWLNVTPDTFPLMKNIVSVTIENGCVDIKEHVFRQNENLVTVNINCDLKTLGARAFSDCYSLTNITLPESLEAIGSHAFYRCKNISISEVPPKVKTIKDYCFYACSGITKFTLHKNISEVAGWAFDSCANLKEVVCLATEPPVLGQLAFYRGHPNKVLYIVDAKLIDAFCVCDPWEDIMKCWTESGYGAFKKENIKELPAGIEITVSSNNTELGTVTSSETGNSIPTGTKLKLTAIPNKANCGRFLHWQDANGNVISKYKILEYIAKNATKITAIFE